jgi:hypothetical protein
MRASDKNENHLKSRSSFNNRFFTAILVLFVLLFAAREIPHFASALQWPYYEGLAGGNLAKDLCDGLVTGILDYAYTPANNIAEGFLLYPAFFIFGKLNAVVVAIFFLMMCVALCILFVFIRGQEGNTAALSAMPALLLMPGLLAQMAAQPVTMHLQQLFWIALLVSLLSAFVSNGRWVWAALFGLVAGVATFNLISNLIAIFILFIAAFCMVDKKRLVRFALFAAPGWALIALQRLRLEKAGYGFTIGPWNGFWQRIRQILTDAFPAACSATDAPDIRSRLLALALLLFWAGLVFIKRKEIVTAFQNAFRIRVSDLPGSFILDFLIILLPPLWIIAASMHAWGVSADNTRYLFLPACILLFAPGRVAHRISWGMWLLIPALCLLALNIGVLPSKKNLSGLNSPKALAISVSGFRGYHYPLYLKRGLAKRLSATSGQKDFKQTIERISQLWKALAVGEAAKNTALSQLPPLSVDPDSLSERQRQLFQEGAARGIIAGMEMAAARNEGLFADPMAIIVRYARIAGLPSPAKDPGLYLGMGEEMLSGLVTFGPSRDLAISARDQGASDTFKRKLQVFESLLAQLDMDAAWLVVRGMGRAGADRKQERYVIEKLLGRLFPAAEVELLINEFTRGIGEGQARKMIFMTQAWPNADDGLCRYLRSFDKAICGEAFEAEAHFWGFIIERKPRGDFWAISFIPIEENRGHPLL